MHTWAPTCIIQLTPAGLETPSSHSATQTALITVYVRPASPLAPLLLAASRYPCAWRDRHYISSPARPAIRHLSDWLSAQTLDQIQFSVPLTPHSPHTFFFFFFFSHQPKKSVSHYESPTHSRALHHLHRTILAQRNRVFPRGAFGASE